MLKVLLKKQISEIFRGYFYNAKKNTARSKAATVGYVLLFVLLMVGIMGGLFTIVSVSLCAPLASLEMSWMYFAIMGLLSILLGAFGSVFNTFSTLYLPKDNDFLLSMPIPVGKLMAARLLSVYLMGLMYSGVVILPAVIVYWIFVSASLQAVLGGILFTLLISVFVLTVSCGLGWVVAKISVRLKNKSFMTVILSLAFFGLYYFFYFKAQEILQDILKNAVIYGEKIKSAAYPVVVFGKAGTGDVLSLVILAAVILALFALMWYIISRSFLKIVTTAGVTSAKAYREGSFSRKSVSAALFRRELARFASSPNYILNCGMGVLFMLIAGGMILIKGSVIYSLLNQVFGSQPGSVLVLLCAGLCAIAAMNDTAAPSVSLEGKSLWVVQSFPIKPWQVLCAKLKVQLVLTLPLMLLCVACLAFVFPMTGWEILTAALLSAVFALLSALFGLFWGVKKAMLDWTAEIIPIKQSAPVALAMLGGLVYAVAYGGLYLVADAVRIGFVPYTAVWIAVSAVLCAVLLAWLKNSGSKIFANL